MKNQPPTARDYVRFGKTGPIIRRDAITAIIPAEIGAKTLVCVVGAPPLDIPLKADAILDAVLDPGSLELSPQELADILKPDQNGKA